MIEALGRPGSPPPKRARPRRRNSSRLGGGPPDVTEGRLRRLDGSPHGPPPPSAGGGSSPSPPLLEPQGPLLSAKRPRAREPHPIRMFMGTSIGRRLDEKQWQATARFLCAPHGPSRGPADRPPSRRADSLAQAGGRRRDHYRRCDRPLEKTGRCAQIGRAHV